MISRNLTNNEANFARVVSEKIVVVSKEKCLQDKLICLVLGSRRFKKRKNRLPLALLRKLVAA